MKLPNGYGSVVKLPGARRKPYAVITSYMEELPDGTAKRKRKYIGYFENKALALTFLAEYNQGAVVKEHQSFSQSPTFAEIFDHAHFSKLSSASVQSNISRSCDRIEAVTGVRPTLFRCPYGEYDDHVIQAAADMGMQTIQWDVDSLDWKELSAGEIARRVRDGVKPGSIVLFHNAAKHTPEALPGVIEDLLRNGYSIVPVSELLLTGDYVMDHTGRMCRPGST